MVAVVLVVRLLCYIYLLRLACLAAAAQSAPDGVYLRLITPIVSTARAGAKFSAVVSGPVLRGGGQDSLTGLMVRGVVERAHAVGMGLRRERASVWLKFESCETPGGEPVACSVDLLDVDNGRETVEAGNKIRGVLAANHPQKWLNGVWFRPCFGLFSRSMSGVAGAGGMVQRGLAPHPAGAALVLASRIALYRMPEPEIGLGEGAELIVRVKADYAGEAEERPGAVESLQLEEGLREAPVEVRRADGRLSDDIINVALLGTREEIERGFAAAGWSTADALTSRTFLKTYSAYSAMESYRTAPVSTLTYGGRAPDLVFQRSLNTLARRHHVRFWRTVVEGEEVWLGAATHDTGIAFDWRRMSLTHRIDGRIDIERTKVANDLKAAGCVESADRVGRELEKEDVTTDGALVVMRMRGCAGRAGVKTGVVKRSLMVKAVRRVVLETRHYVVRCNAYYWAYKAVRLGR